MSKRSKKRRTKKKKKIIIIPILIVLIIGIGFGIYYIKENQQAILEATRQAKQEDIVSHYNTFVKTNKEANIYILKDEEYIKNGTISSGQELELSQTTITYQSEYLKLVTFDSEYYIYYKDIEPIDTLTEISDRYKNYIPFNKNIITNDITNFYDEEDNLIYSINSSFDLPIIINKEDIYGVIYNNTILYIKKEDVKEIKENKNTDKTNTKGIAVLNYHFFYDASNPDDKCNQGICLSTQKLKEHLEYFKKNNVLTLTLKELEMYIDGELQLPKSIVLTIDDGWRAKAGARVIAEYEMNATIFLISSEYDPKNYENKYIETHSHGHDIHNAGVCPGGQGGPIKCLEKSKLLEDLAKSREKLNNTTYFCYPFYEYNDYSISALKEAGFTMAFGGEYEGGVAKASPGINKFKIPRFVIMNYTTVNDIASYVNM